MCTVYSWNSNYQYRLCRIRKSLLLLINALMWYLISPFFFRANLLHRLSQMSFSLQILFLFLNILLYLALLKKVCNMLTSWCVNIDLAIIFYRLEETQTYECCLFPVSLPLLWSGVLSHLPCSSTVQLYQVLYLLCQCIAYITSAW